MKDLNSFITEKAKAKKKEKPLKRKQGADDAVFLELMGKYKKERRKDYDKAQKIRKDAEQLKKTGDVSADASLAANYI